MQQAVVIAGVFAAALGPVMIGLGSVISTFSSFIAVIGTIGAQGGILLAAKAAIVGLGVGLGTVLAFMMAVTALSLPSLIMLKRVVKLPLLATFTGVVTVGILTIGFTFNVITHWFI